MRSVRLDVLWAWAERAACLFVAALLGPTCAKCSYIIYHKSVLMASYNTTYHTAAAVDQLGDLPEEPRVEEERKGGWMNGVCALGACVDDETPRQRQTS